MIYYYSLSVTANNNEFIQDLISYDLFSDLNFLVHI